MQNKALNFFQNSKQTLTTNIGRVYSWQCGCGTLISEAFTETKFRAIYDSYSSLPCLSMFQSRYAQPRLLFHRLFSSLESFEVYQRFPASGATAVQPHPFRLPLAATDPCISVSQVRGANTARTAPGCCAGVFLVRVSLRAWKCEVHLSSECSF